MGRELNPRIGSLDIKYVLFRSGIIGWILFNTINLFKSREIYGYHSPTMVALFSMQLLYVVDYFWLEGGILVSRDIVHEGLGYNILVQFLMIPFCFCVQTRYLMTTGYQLPLYGLLSVVTLNGTSNTHSVHSFVFGNVRRNTYSFLWNIFQGDSNIEKCESHGWIQMGDKGSGPPPPEKSQRYRVSLQYWSRSPEKITKLPRQHLMLGQRNAI